MERRGDVVLQHISRLVLPRIAREMLVSIRGVRALHPSYRVTPPCTAPRNSSPRTACRRRPWGYPTARGGRVDLPASACPLPTSHGRTVTATPSGRRSSCQLLSAP